MNDKIDIEITTNQYNLNGIDCNNTIGSRVLNDMISSKGDKVAKTYRQIPLGRAFLQLSKEEKEIILIESFARAELDPDAFR